MAAHSAVMDFGKNKTLVIIGGTVFALAALALVSSLIYQDEAAWRETLSSFLEQARGTPWALPLVCGLYVLSGIVFFPIMLLNLACALVFGLWGIVYAIVGAMLNAALYFAVGYWVRRHKGGKKWMERHKLGSLDEKFKKAGLAGVVLIQTLPAPPFMITNVVAGISSVNFLTFMAGTFLALLPGAIARGIVGDSLSKIILNPTQETWLYLGLGILLWIGLVGGTHALLKKCVPQE